MPKSTYYVVLEVVTDPDGLISTKIIKTTEIMPIIPDEEGAE